MRKTRIVIRIHVNVVLGREGTKLHHENCKFCWKLRIFCQKRTTNTQLLVIDIKGHITLSYTYLRHI